MRLSFSFLQAVFFWSDSDAFLELPLKIRRGGKAGSVADFLQGIVRCGQHDLGRLQPFPQNKAGQGFSCFLAEDGGDIIRIHMNKF